MGLPNTNTLVSAAMHMTSNYHLLGPSSSPSAVDVSCVQAGYSYCWHADHLPCYCSQHFKQPSFTVQHYLCSSLVNRHSKKPCVLLN